MKIANNLIRSFLIMTVIQCVVLPALAVDNYKTFRRDFWEFEVATQYFRSEANFTSSGGSYSKLPNGNYFQQLDLNVGSRFVADKDFAFYGYVGIGNSESKSSNITRSNSALSSALLGAEYLVYSDFIQIIPEISVLVPMEAYSNSGDTVMNNEGALEVRPALTVQSDFSGSMLWYGKLGFTYRDQGRSFLLPWHAGLEFKLPSSRLGARVSGFHSIADDGDTNNKTARIAASDNVNGGSLKWYAINPSVVSADGYYRFRVADRWVGQVQAGFDLTGTNYAAGFFVGAFLRYAFDISSWYRETPYQMEETTVERPTGQSQMYQDRSTKTPPPPPQFKENTDDGVDQKIFRIKPVTNEPATGELQRELQDAEMKVNLRTNKKKTKKKR